MSEKQFRASQDAKAAGWYSRRHETREAQNAARERYHAMHGRAARQRRARERQQAAIANEGAVDLGVIEPSE